MVQRISSALFVAVGFVLFVGVAPAQAQRQAVALKDGETTVLGELYWVSNCRSILKSPPEVEVIDGPPGLTAEVKEAMVLPRRQSCPNKVPGGLLSVSAKNIEDPSTTRVTLRITYRTKDGDRQRAWLFNLALLP